jgi:hypothetical protein
MKFTNENDILKTLERFNETQQKIVYVKSGDSENYVDPYIITSSKNIGKSENSRCRIISATYSLYIINSFGKLDIPNKQWLSVVEYMYYKNTDEPYQSMDGTLKSARLQTIHVTIPNKGYGSTLMIQLLKDIKRMPIYKSGCEITGRLDTWTDGDHKERLYHFYKKFGFEIDDKSNIKLILKSH